VALAIGYSQNIKGEEAMATADLTASCVVCETPNIARRSAGGFDVRYDCGRCGAFALSDTAEQRVLPNRFREDPLRRSVMSWALRRMHRPDHAHLRVIKDDELPSFWTERLPNPRQLADSLIFWIGDNQSTPTAVAEVPRAEVAATIGLHITSGDDNPGMSWLIGQLHTKSLFEQTPRQGDVVAFRLSMAGWDEYERLRKGAIESRTAFMAMKFGDATLDNVIETCFRPAVARAGFELRKLTDRQPAGLIDDQIRASLLTGRFVIADLTHGSHGAYWEAGFAEGLGRPVIYTCEQEAWNEKKTHFDTNHMLTIIWKATDLDKTGNELTATIRATLRAEAKQTDE
jgi:hypothetical protein